MIWMEDSRKSDTLELRELGGSYIMTEMQQIVMSSVCFGFVL